MQLGEWSWEHVAYTFTLEAAGTAEMHMLREEYGQERKKMHMLLGPPNHLQRC
jgi:hypothetical protein